MKVHLTGGSLSVKGGRAGGFSINLPVVILTLGHANNIAGKCTSESYFLERSYSTR